MKMQILLASLLLANSAGAAIPKSLSLDVKLVIGENLIVHDKIAAVPGKVQSIVRKDEKTGEWYSIQITPKSKPGSTVIQYDLVISKAAAGQVTVISKPQILTERNEAAKIEQGGANPYAITLAPL